MTHVRWKGVVVVPTWSRADYWATAKDFDQVCRATVTTVRIQAPDQTYIWIFQCAREFVASVLCAWGCVWGGFDHLVRYQILTIAQQFEILWLTVVLTSSVFPAEGASKNGLFRSVLEVPNIKGESPLLLATRGCSARKAQMVISRNVDIPRGDSCNWYLRQLCIQYYHNNCDFHENSFCYETLCSLFPEAFVSWLRCHAIGGGLDGFEWNLNVPGCGCSSDVAKHLMHFFSLHLAVSWRWLVSLISGFGRPRCLWCPRWGFPDYKLNCNWFFVVFFLISRVTCWPTVRLIHDSMWVFHQNCVGSWPNWARDQDPCSLLHTFAPPSQTLLQQLN